MSIRESVLRALDERDWGDALDALAREPDALSAVKSAAEVMRELYWKRKDLSASVLFACAGMSLGLASAAKADASEASLALQIRSIVKGLAYDVASFTWPGWDEPGIVITPSDLRFGMEAAKMNLRLAGELQKSALPMSRAHWMLAGHLLCVRDFAGARSHYLEGAKHGATAGSRADELLGMAFAAIADIASGVSDDSARAQIESARKALPELPDGKMFASQIDTALRVFTTARDAP